MTQEENDENEERAVDNEYDGVDADEEDDDEEATTDEETGYNSEGSDQSDPNVHSQSLGQSEFLSTEKLHQVEVKGSDTFALLPIPEERPGMRNAVDFHSEDAVSRPPLEDELFAMDRFKRHASGCPECANPYKVALEGRTLCDRGHGLAQNVTRHFYIRDGIILSKFDRTSTRVPEQVEIPKGYGVIRDLLYAPNHELKKKNPDVRSGVHYSVPDRGPSSIELRPTQMPRGRKVMEAEPRRASRKHEIGRESGKKKKTIRVPGRGSLYEEDEKARKEHGDEEPVITYVAPTHFKTPKKRHKEEESDTVSKQQASEGSDLEKAEKNMKPRPKI
ncbi:MAG: hypothetical protein Q9227_000604 [Pyrenula ochraceoflavens]